MSDIFREVDEDLRRDQLVSFWKRYGATVVGGAVLIVVATAGYVGWKEWRASEMEKRTAVLSAALAKARPEEGAPDVKVAGDALAAAASQLGQSQAVIARLYEAGLRARNGQRDEAVALYDQIAGSGESDALLRDMATLLSVQLQMDAGDPAKLGQRIAPLLTAGNPWRASATELAGLLAAKTGDNARAEQLFKQLAEDAQAPQGVRSRATELAALFAAPK
ncbi:MULTISPECIES: tetratricopeptide repeat protein [unclassified Azospirillum]|uniref:tetratricopeptide repeat protein n=1 Tax=unclassified Azospirillum TaxID=2630922 RepID=UPI000B6A0DF4|nr:MULTISPECIES: tetratricopeptide repeat protein [unclassified Azospirillum]SNS11441.1 hypothetical protein SAMN05880556_10235 [Azospirillum sp. RU38E]SNS28202.1 hypothetical protein SAMN05880591_10235 [Azospirillum sp. RU37A]